MLRNPSGTLGGPRARGTVLGSGGEGLTLIRGGHGCDRVARCVARSGTSSVASLRLREGLLESDLDISMVGRASARGDDASSPRPLPPSFMLSWPRLFPPFAPARETADLLFPQPPRDERTARPKGHSPQHALPATTRAEMSLVDAVADPTARALAPSRPACVSAAARGNCPCLNAA